MDTLSITLQSSDEKAKLSATARDNPPVIIDYFPPVGTGQGYTSLELLMAAFGSCVSTTILSLLRYRMKKTVAGVTAEVSGIVRDSHPKALESMKATLHIKADDLSETEAAQAVKTAEDGICPVWAMIKGNVDIDVVIKIE